MNKLWFPLMLALILGGLTAWLGRISEVKLETVQLDPNEPQYEMLGIVGKRFDEAGKLKESLEAERVWQLPQSEIVWLKSPELRVFQAGLPDYNVQSNLAQYHTNDRKVFFQDNVWLHKAARGKHMATEVRTRALWVDTRNGLAQTDAEVEFKQGQSQGSAVGLRYHHQTEQLQLNQKVRAIIYDVSKS